jgi:nicotinate-nucleotide adenylyltransferase
MTKRIGILGGTFNPIHIGHLSIAQTVQEKFELEKVLFVPAFRPPHRSITRLASPEERFQMVRLGIKSNPLFEVSDFEIKREGKSYSIDTVKHFRKVYPKGTKLFFIIGADNFAELSEWKCIDEILEIVSFIVVNRPGYEIKNSKIKHYVVNMPGMDIASSHIRRLIAQGKSVKYLVPESVFRYIKRKKIFK